VTKPDRAEIGILGGSGLYAMAGLEDPREIQVETPFGFPSGSLIVGRLGGRAVAFLARHGRNHNLLPGEIPYRANVCAMKQLGVKRILSASAVGSMKVEYRPRDVVIPDQFVDRTRNRLSTFFGDGVVAHVSMADPTCPEVRRALAAAARQAGGTVHEGGAYLCMEGPAFSTRAESFLYRSWGMDVIGMTNSTEARLAREAGVCYATMALVTDYDCWHEEEETVTVEMLLGHLRANARLAAETIATAVGTLPPRGGGCTCPRSVRDAIVTPQDSIPVETRRRLAVILGDEGEI
jgi:5'-methylthioadenosine phosphorylase